MTKTPQVPQQYNAGFLSSLDGRTAIAANMNQRYRQLTDDLGGSTRLSYAQLSLCERALFLEYWLQEQERDLAAGKEFDAAKWVQGANSLQGIFAKLGLRRIAHDVTDLADYLNQVHGKAE